MVFTPKHHWNFDTRAGLCSGNRREFCDFRELVAREFDTLIGPVAASLVLSTALAAATTPLALALLAST
jgi:hypothetical protein